MFKFLSVVVLLGVASMNESANVLMDTFYESCFSNVNEAAAAAAKAKAPVPPPQNAICTSQNSYSPVDGNCDAYIECRDYVQRQMMCPDGLHYDPTAVWPAYPCGYPMDVPCKGRGIPQIAQPTSECPHQYGFYPSLTADPKDCGQYRMCVAGMAIEMLCPPGLAFNPDSAKCDWPELVPSCNAADYLGFKCPPVPVDADGNPMDLVQNYKYEGQCYAFFSCEGGRARLLSCDAGYAFNAITGQCEDAEKVVCEESVQPISTLRVM